VVENLGVLGVLAVILIIGCSVTLLAEPQGASCLFLYWPPRKWRQRHAAMVANFVLVGSAFFILPSAFITPLNKH